MRLRHLALAAILACGLSAGTAAAPTRPAMAGAVAPETIAAEAPTEWTGRRGRRYRGYRGYRGYRSGYRRRYRSYRSYRYRPGSYARRRGGDRVEVRPETPSVSRGSRPTFDYGGVRR